MIFFYIDKPGNGTNFASSFQGVVKKKYPSTHQNPSLPAKRRPEPIERGEGGSDAPEHLFIASYLKIG